MKLSQYAQQQGISYSTALHWWHQGTLRGYQVVKLVKEVGSGVNDSPPKLLSLLRDPMITRLVVELQIDSPASVSGISRPFWKYKEERLKWQV